MATVDRKERASVIKEAKAVRGPQGRGVSKFTAKYNVFL
jgi:hypothetical protein